MSWRVRSWRPRRPPRADAVLALVAVTAAVALQATTAAPTGTPQWFAGPGVAAVAVLAAMTLPLSYRRIAPVGGVLVHLCAAACLPIREEPPWSLLPATAAGLLLLWSVADHRPPGLSVPLLAGSVLLDVVTQPEPRLVDAALGLALTAAVWSGGWSARRRRLARARAFEAAVAAERARMVGELNDLVAHQVLGIVLQSATPRDEASARAALAEIDAVAREALAAMRRMLRLLRRSGTPALPSPPARGRWRPGPSDVAVAIGPLFVLIFLAPPATGPAAAFGPLLATDPVRTLPLLAPALLALLVRRRAPLVTLAAVVLAQLGYEAAGGDVTPTNTAVLVAAYSLGAWSGRPARYLPAVTAAMVALGATAAAGFPPDTDRGPIVAAMPCVLGVGVVVRQLRRRRDRQRHDDQRAAVDVQRTLLARELHDVVASHVSGIIVQATAAASEPTPGPALSEIGISARAALDGLRQLFDLADDTPSLAPQPGLSDLEDLVRAARAAGLRVDLDLAVPEDRSPGAELGLLAHRVVQEALTNCVKHAAGGRVRVSVDYGVLLVIRVGDDGGDGRGAPLPADPGGYGLAGMRERVELLGGTLSAGLTSAGGWLVDARVPAGAPAPAPRGEERWPSRS